MKKNTICLWYNHDAEEAARFYARTFPDSTVGAVQRAPSDFPGGKAGDAPVLRFSQEEAAHMLGASRQTVNRVLNEWEAAGIVRLSYRTLTLADLTAIRRLCRA